MGGREYREQLISEVRRRPVLYDTRHEHHRDIDVRDRCWADIAATLHVDSEVLKREWKILRDSLRQSLRKVGGGGGAGGKRWRFQSNMSFVLPYMTRRSKRASVQDSRVEAEPEAPGREDEPPEPWPGPAGDDDALEMFFASVCQSAKRLPPTYQRQLKRQVLDALLRAEEGAAGGGDVDDKTQLYATS